MSAPGSILQSLGLDRLLEADPTGAATGSPLTFASAEMIRGFHYVIERERTGAWRSAMKATGHTTGRKFGVSLDALLAAHGQPALDALPLEACLALLEQHLTNLGWGKLQLDLTDAAQHGLVVARLQHSVFAEALADVPDFVDPLPAGMLQGFFEHISGQTLGCEEIACVRHGAPHCTFVITAPERLARIMPAIGRENADTLLARLRS